MSWRAVPILGCRDVRTTAEWYRDVLGFTLDPESGLFVGVVPDEGAVYAIVSRDGGAIHLQIRRGDRPSARGEIETDAYIYVDDADQLYGEFDTAAVPIHRPIENAAYGMRDFCIVDPEGNRVAFGCPA